MSPLGHQFKKASGFFRASPLIATKDYQTKYAFLQFAKKSGLVYFGSTAASTDGSRLVRGVTLTSKHTDAHYCLGVHDGYDIACVQRSGEMSFPGKKSTKHSWIIMEFDLHSASPLPHILIGRKNEAELLYDNMLTINRDMQEHIFSTPDQHKKEYIKQYATYSPPAYAHMVEFVISPEFSSAIVSHFKNLLIEIEGDNIYLFIDQPKPTAAFLNKMMHYGLMVAKHIDERLGAK